MSTITKEIYRKAFAYLAERTTIDYALNLEYEYGVEEVLREAYETGFGE
jgi:hypothetical protein